MWSLRCKSYNNCPLIRGENTTSGCLKRETKHTKNTKITKFPNLSYISLTKARRNKVQIPKPSMQNKNSKVNSRCYKWRQGTLLQRLLFKTSRQMFKIRDKDQFIKRSPTQRNTALLSKQLKRKKNTVAAMCLQTHSTHGTSVWSHTESNNVTKSRSTINGN